MSAGTPLSKIRITFQERRKLLAPVLLVLVLLLGRWGREYLNAEFPNQTCRANAITADCSLVDCVTNTWQCD